MDVRAIVIDRLGHILVAADDSRTISPGPTFAPPRAAVSDQLDPKAIARAIGMRYIGRELNFTGPVHECKEVRMGDTSAEVITVFYAAYVDDFLPALRADDTSARWVSAIVIASAPSDYSPSILGDLVAILEN